MNDTGYAFHPEAKLDLEGVWHHVVRESGFPTRADHVSDSILDAIGKLVPFPGMGHRRPDLTKRESVRFFLVYDYLIAYVHDRKPLWVLAVLYGRRNPELLTSILSGRE